ncbi:MAG: ATP-binding protein [Candidatus Competibacterales bacterium]
MVRVSSLKVRLVLISAGVLLVSLNLAFLFLLHNAKVAVRAEMASTLELVDQLILGVLPRRSYYFEGERHSLGHLVERLREVRHLTVSVAPEEPEGAAGARALPAPHEVEAPAWFTALIGPDLEQLPTVVLRGALNRGETVVISANPADEIEEIWEDVKVFLALAGALLVGLTALLYLAVQQGLKPLGVLLTGFQRLERGDFSARVPPAMVQELEALHGGFNHLSEVLADTTRSNRLLARRLLSLQDDERRALASELHDEAGPCFFGLKADAALIRDHLSQGDVEAIAPRLDSIDALVERLQAQSRRILLALRPASIDGDHLAEAIHQLVAGWRARLPHVDWQLTLPAEPLELDPEVASTVYRIVQEGVTNVVKHARASRASISLGLWQNQLVVEIRDDGDGLDPEAHRLGLGLMGIRERAEALGGDFAVSSGRGMEAGVTVRVALPAGAGAAVSN